MLNASPERQSHGDKWTDVNRRRPPGPGPRVPKGALYGPVEGRSELGLAEMVQMAFHGRVEEQAAGPGVLAGTDLGYLDFQLRQFSHKGPGRAEGVAKHAAGTVFPYQLGNSLRCPGGSRQMVDYFDVEVPVRAVTCNSDS